MLKNTLAVVLPMFFIVSNGCRDPLPSASGIISDPHDRWKAYHITSYTVEERRICFCPASDIVAKVYVVDDRIVDVIDMRNGASLRPKTWGWFKTVNELFQMIGTIDTQAVAAFSVSYDPGYGHPTLFFVDPNINMADEEYGYTLSHLEPGIY